MGVLNRERGGQHDDLALGEHAPKLARRLDPVHDRHVEIHQHDLRAQFLSQAEGLLAVPGRAGVLQAVVDVEGQTE